MKLNTSNLGKFEEFKRLFLKYHCNLEATHIDLKEIQADPVTVLAHKASQLGENIIVEDTSLEIEGAAVGINVRWLLEHLTDYVGRRAEWTVLLGIHQNDQILIYKGVVEGTIVHARGDKGFGFDPVFLPTGSTKTLAEAKPDAFNARAKAVEAFINGTVWKIHPYVDKWTGPWQK